MMETIITQRFQYATITPFRNYCRISDNKHSANTFNDDIDDLTDQSTASLLNVVHSEFRSACGRVIYFNEPRGKKKNTKYFFNDNDMGENIQIDFGSKKNNRFFNTTKDRHIKKYFNNPFTEMSIHTVQRSIIQYDNKITIKIYKLKKARDINCRFFNRSSTIRSITINTLTGNFTTSEFHKGSTGKPEKFFRTNSFKKLRSIINHPMGFIKCAPPGYLTKDEAISEEFRKAMDSFDFNMALSKVLKIDYYDYSESPEILFNQLVEKFAKEKKIKMPNGVLRDLLYLMYPTEKFLKKNDRKLIASLLDYFGIKSKITIRLMHTHPTIHIPELVKLCNLFGDDYQKYLGSMSDDFFDTLTNKTSTGDGWDYSLKTYKTEIDADKTNIQDHIISDDEKSIIVKILSGKSNELSSISVATFIHSLYDHFRMIKMLSEYGVIIKLRGRNYSEFSEQHQELSRMISSVRKGWVVQYLYDEETLKVLEEPILQRVDVTEYPEPSEFITDLMFKELIGKCEKKYETRSYYPVVLKREEEYTEEGSFMHHCVAGYANKERSMIISVRTEEDSRRVTNEFNIEDGRLIQSKHFYNAVPPPDFITPLEVVAQRVQNLTRIGKLGWTSKEKVRVKINGIELSDEAILRLTERNPAYNNWW